MKKDHQEKIHRERKRDPILNPQGHVRGCIVEHIVERKAGSTRELIRYAWCDGKKIGGNPDMYARVS